MSRTNYRYLRDKAAKKGEKHYQGKPCINCNGTTRFVSSACCINCTRERNKISEKKNRCNAKDGEAIYDKNYTPTKLKDWPQDKGTFEDTTPPISDGGRYVSRPSHLLPYASSAALAVECE